MHAIATNTHNVTQFPKTVEYNISTCAVLVEFNVSQWTARKLDKSTTDEVLRDKNAGERGAARVNKHLLAGRKELEIIQQHVTATRNYMYTNTLPWSDAGMRLLPVAKLIEFTQYVDNAEAIFNQLVDDFIAIYPTLITAQALALGAMFNRDDFPTPQELRHKFSFRMNVMPVPSAGDFRVDVGVQAERELKNKLNSLANERVTHAMQDIKTRLKEHLDRMSDRLAVDVVNNETKTRKFHNTLVETAHELCDLVRHLNLTNDPDLEAARQQLAQTINGLTADDLRNNLDVRSEVKQNVDAIRNAFAF